MIGFYAVRGQYHYAAIGEAPNDAAAMASLLGLGSQGNVRTRTLNAFSKEEFAEIVKKLP